GPRSLVPGVLHPLPGAPVLRGQQRGEGLDADWELAADPTADTGHDHANHRGRYLEDLRERGLDLERQLGVRPHRDLAGAVPLGDGRPRLRVALVNAGRGEAMLEDPVGLGEAALDVADHDARAVADVAPAMEDRQRRVL